MPLWLLLLLLMLLLTMAWDAFKDPAVRVETDDGNPRGLTQTIITEAFLC